MGLQISCGYRISFHCGGNAFSNKLILVNVSAETHNSHGHLPIIGIDSIDLIAIYNKSAMVQLQTAASHQQHVVNEVWKGGSQYR